MVTKSKGNSHLRRLKNHPPFSFSVFKSWLCGLFLSGSERGNAADMYTVFLKKGETKSWKHLVKLLDEGKLQYLPDFQYPRDFILFEEDWFQVDIEHPFVRVIGSFAFNSFNKAYEMFVDKGNHNQLSDPIFTACKSLKGCYEVVITIEALEDGFCGIYDARVACGRVKKLTLMERVRCNHVKLTLMQFSLIGKKVVEGASASASKNPKADPSGFTGMSTRMVGDGWDYYNPSEFVRG